MKRTGEIFLHLIDLFKDVYNLLFFSLFSNNIFFLTKHERRLYNFRRKTSRFFLLRKNVFVIFYLFYLQLIKPQKELLQTFRQIWQPLVSECLPYGPEKIANLLFCVHKFRFRVYVCVLDTCSGHTNRQRDR